MRLVAWTILLTGAAPAVAFAQAKTRYNILDEVGIEGELVRPHLQHTQTSRSGTRHRNAQGALDRLVADAEASVRSEDHRALHAGAGPCPGSNRRCPASPRPPDYRRAIALFDKALAQYPTSTRVPSIRYRLAELLLRRGAGHDSGRAVRLLKEIIRSHSASATVPGALVLLGDRYFERMALRAAALFYERATRYPAHPVAPYARYKLGWVHYNLGRYAKAVRSFLGVRRSAKPNLRKQATNDLVLALASLPNLTRAPDLLRRELGPKASLEYVSLLARRLEDRGRFAEAMKVYHYLLAKDPSPSGQAKHLEDRDSLARRLGLP